MMFSQSWRSGLIVCLSTLFLQGQVVADEINAVLEWSDKRQLGTTLSARVERVPVTAGMQVKQGALLVQLDQRHYASRKTESAAALEHARLELEEAQREQDRAIELYDRTVLSEYDRQKADRDLARAKAMFEQARADDRRARLDIEYSQINSPYMAVVLKVDVRPGEVVVNQLQTAPLVTVARADEMLVKVMLDTAQLSTIQLNQKLDVAFRGKWLSGEVQQIGYEPKMINNKPFYEVAVKMPVQPDQHARAGEASAIRLP